MRGPNNGGRSGQIIEGSTVYTIAADLNQLTKYSLVAGRCEYIGREGIEFYPQELQLFRYVDTFSKDAILVENIQVARSKFRIPLRTFPVETKYLFPLVKGPGIGIFEYNDPGLIVAFPYEPISPHAPISRDRLEVESPLLLRHYEQHREQLMGQTKYSDSIRGEGEYYGLARTGPYSFESCYVAFRDNTKWCATVITTKEMPWGETKRYVFQNHAVSICERSDGSYITEDEAYYVAGILNAPIVGSFINESSDDRSYKIRPPVYVPLFDPGNDRHRQISRLAREATSGSLDIEEAREQIEGLYLSLCALREVVDD